ncbi:MAG: prepilin peptidase [Candidatus Altiarchaeota archaeon]
MLETLVVGACLAVLAAAAWIDLKTGEVPEWCSLGIAMIVGAPCLACAAYFWDLGYVFTPALWGAVAFAVAYVVFYLGQWGGGDVKLLGGIGGLLGFLDAGGYSWPNDTFMYASIPPLLTYAVNMALLAGPYVILYTLLLGLGQPRVFPAFLERFRGRRTLFAFAFSIIPLVFAVYYGVFVLAWVYALVPLMVVAQSYMKTVEETLMTKTIKVSELKEWDIIAEDAVVDGKAVAPKGNIEGITPEQLAVLKAYSLGGKFKDTIKTKWGVKFVPVLFLSLPATIYAGNLLELVFAILFQDH